MLSLLQSFAFGFFGNLFVATDFPLIGEAASFKFFLSHDNSPQITFTIIAKQRYFSRVIVARNNIRHLFSYPRYPLLHHDQS